MENNFNKYQQDSHKRNGVNYKVEQAKARSVYLPDFLKRIYGFNLIEEYSYFVNDDKDQHFRVYFKDGLWLTNSSIGIKGDAINTVLAIERLNGRNIDFKEAVKIILGTHTTSVNIFVPPTKIAPKSNIFKLIPNVDSDIDSEKIYQYISSRGINRETWDSAVAKGFCSILSSYKDRPPCVRFIGSDEQGIIRSSDQRFLYPIIEPSGKVTIKRCQKGSEREFAPVLIGDPDSEEIHIVEGGFSALGLREILERSGIESIPTIIMSGGRDMTAFTKTVFIESLLKKANRVSIWVENELIAGTVNINPKKQLETLQAAKKLQGTIKQITNRSVVLEQVPMTYSDTADWNLKVK